MHPPRQNPSRWLDEHIPKGYIYFAMAFSVLVEFLNQQLRKPKSPPVRLHEPYVGSDKPTTPGKLGNANPDAG